MMLRAFSEHLVISASVHSDVTKVQRRFEDWKAKIVASLIFCSNVRIRYRSGAQIGLLVATSLVTSTKLSGGSTNDIFVNENENKNENYLQKENHSGV